MALMSEERLAIRMSDPVDRVWSLYWDRDGEARREIDERGWSLADVYLELGGGGPRSSELHERFGDFFNGQTRAALAEEDRAKLDFWAGMPERGAALRDIALEALARDEGVAATDVDGTAVDRRTGREHLDPQTRSLILAHNQIDAELHAHASALAERERMRPRRSVVARTLQLGGAVCVLGAPRSGTSLTARVLNVLGVDLGRQDELMAPAAENNRMGFWEHKGIADLNEEILAALSDSPPPHLQGWRWPPALAPGWEDDPLLEPHRRAATTILRGSFSGRRRWGWKDPRTSLTLRFWQQLVPEMRYVICVRHPLDVAASLAARDEMPAEEALRLWHRYMADAVACTKGRPRLVVAYESYFPDWEEQARRLAAFLGAPQPGDEQRKAIAAHLDHALWHHRTPADGEGKLPAECASLHAELSKLAQA